MKAQTAQRLAKGQSLGGRPTKYNPEIIRKTAEYMENYGSLGEVIPSIAGLAKQLDVTRERLATWAKDKNKGEFIRMYSMLRNAQEVALLNGGLNGGLNSAITKLVLSKHGYTDNPQANQGVAGITVNVNRGGVTVQAGGQSVTVQADQDAPGREPVTIEHE